MVLYDYGWAGVDLFLVLSAFLITNLLLLEQQRTGTISLKDFYIRRSLRIWPLYFLMILIGFFISPIISGKFTAPDHQKLLAGDRAASGRCSDNALPAWSNSTTPYAVGSSTQWAKMAPPSTWEKRSSWRPSPCP